MGSIAWSKQRVGITKSTEASAGTSEERNGYNLNITDSNLWLRKIK